MIPTSIRNILSGELPISQSGGVSVVSAPDFEVSGPTPELTSFFDDVTRRMNVRRMLPCLFSALENGGIVHVLSPYWCDACGMGRDLTARIWCDHHDLVLNEPLVVDRKFIHGRDWRSGPNTIVSLRQISEGLSPEGRLAMEREISLGDDLLRLWADMPLQTGEVQFATLSVPVGSVWGTDSASVMFSNQMSVIGGWIGDICQELARVRCIPLDHIWTLSGEIPAPRPEVTWRC